MTRTIPSLPSAPHGVPVTCGGANEKMWMRRSEWGQADSQVQVCVCWCAGRSSKKKHQRVVAAVSGGGFQRRGEWELYARVCMGFRAGVGAAGAFAGGPRRQRVQLRLGLGCGESSEGPLIAWLRIARVGSYGARLGRLSREDRAERRKDIYDAIMESLSGYTIQIFE